MVYKLINIIFKSYLMISCDEIYDKFLGLNKIFKVISSQTYSYMN